LTGLLPASPVRKGGVKGSYTKMAIFLTGKPRPGGRGGFTQPSSSLLPNLSIRHMSLWRKQGKKGLSRDVPREKPFPRFRGLHDGFAPE